MVTNIIIIIIWHKLKLSIKCCSDYVYVKNHTDMRRIVLNISPNLVRNINTVIDDDINAYEIIFRANRKRMFRLRQSKVICVQKYFHK